MKTLTLIAILSFALLVATAGEELEALEGYPIEPEDDTAVAPLEDERLFECVISCDIEKEGKPCKPKGEKECKPKGGWKCKFNFCLKV
uniref:Omega-Liphistoxin-Lth1a_1 n=2 Tax=Araneae TaxID=6893 RepID=A0A4Q8K0R2_9ARAC|nr:putative mature sequence toxin-like LFEC [Pelinobius muticus]ADF28497.1 putative mature peptide toxin-like LFEC [Pelinobius muticus]